MAATDLTTVRTFLPSIASVPDGTINLIIADSQDVVEGDGVGINDPAFEKMHRYMTAHVLSTSGLLKETTSASVKDVSRANVANVRSEGSSPYLKLYQEQLTKLFGLGNRIAVDI